MTHLERAEALRVLLPGDPGEEGQLLGLESAGERDISKQFPALAVLNCAAGENPDAWKNIS